MKTDHIALLDHHAHAIFREDVWRTTPLSAYFTEAYDAGVLAEHTPHAIFYRRSLRDLAAFYGCAPTLDDVMLARASRPYLTLARDLIRAANIDEVLLDDGFMPDELLSVAECDALLPWRARRVLRLEVELAALVAQHDGAQALLDAFEQRLRAVSPGIVGFKSVIAYRTGLDVQTWSGPEVEAEYAQLKRGLVPGRLPRLTSKPLLDTALRVGLRVARDLGLPVQFHTGYGDPDLDLRLANPLHLRGVIEDAGLRGLQVVLLHCYPYTRQAGYLASVYPGVFLDLGLTIPFTSQHAMRTHVHEALHLAPLSKVLLSTDASRTPELYYLAALWGRRVLERVLDATVADGDLTAQEAEAAAWRVLRGNALQLYSLDGAERAIGGPAVTRSV
ncbi:amidohydrolase family protein [Deinococcus apachensis]|uniref:amidohydrolase family protein n=1 Tax=Deinococcus apachensis TaxID=309886 RepID=UPI00037C1506|nr:amidohydrolase family protein [Deinococcus apachensis]